MLIIAGLGNPGSQYEKHRHNIGFMAVDRIAGDNGFGPWKKRFSSLVAEGSLPLGGGASVKTLVIKPQTFMNKSGHAVAEAMRFYKLPATSLVVFHDEIDLAPGRFRMKAGGGHAGQNGLRSIIAQYEAHFRRGRIGVGHPGDKAKVGGYVLSDFPKAEQPWVETLLDAISRSVEYLANGDDDRFQTEVLRLAPAPKFDARTAARQSPND